MASLVHLAETQFLRLLVPAFLCALVSSSVNARDTSAQLSAGAVTVKVSGYGETLQEARADAVRQAMQAAVAQLVVADRSVSEDEILADRVISTMNGFVDRVEELQVGRANGEIEVTARITVSTARIATFVSRTAEDAKVDGASLFGEVSRDIAQRDAVVEILSRALRGYPASVLQSTVKSVQPSQKDPNILDLAIEFKADPAWGRSMHDVLEALATARVEVGAPTARVEVGAGSSFADCRNNLLDAKLVPQICASRSGSLANFVKAAVGDARTTLAVEVRARTRPICVVSEQDAVCYQLPISDYSSVISASLGGRLVPEQVRLGFLFLPLNKAGELTTAGECCKFIEPTPGVVEGGDQPSKFRAGFQQLGSPLFLPINYMFNTPNPDVVFVNVVYLGAIQTTAQIDIASFGLAETDRVVLRPALFFGLGTESPVWDVALGAAQAPIQDIVAKTLEEAALSR